MPSEPETGRYQLGGGGEGHKESSQIRRASAGRGSWRGEGR